MAVNDKIKYRDLLNNINKSLNGNDNNYEIKNIAFQNSIYLKSQFCFVESIDDTNYIKNKCNEMFDKFKYKKYFTEFCVEFYDWIQPTLSCVILILFVDSDNEELNLFRNKTLLDMYKSHAFTDNNTLKPNFDIHFDWKLYNIIYIDEYFKNKGYYYDIMFENDIGIFIKFTHIDN